MRAYDVVDVFTDRAFAGNPLAVVHGTDGLGDAQLAAIAREFNLSETTFPTPRGDTAYDVRIFTPAGEIPFAGHPTIGTAWVLGRQGALATGTVVQHCGAGEVEVELPDDEAGRVRLSAVPRDLVGPVDAVPLAAALGLPAELVAGEVLVAGCGLSWVHLPVAAEALERCRVGGALADRLPGAAEGLRDPVGGVNVYAVVTGPEGVQVRSRVFCPDVGVVEDPATGSAAAGLGIVLAAQGILPDGGDFLVRQGVEMGRPSTLHGSVEAEAGRARRCRVAGSVVPVASGTIAVPAPDGLG